MNKKEFLLLILMSVLFANCYSQSNNIKLSDNIQLTYKDVLELRLQILAAQMTSGCYTIEDMGGIDDPVSIAINKQNKIVFAPSADEVARRAYFSYVNQGALQGHDVQHWLDAEAELIAERNLTRVHGFHNRT